MSIALFSAGSNAKGQLANGTVDDSHCFLRCAFDGDAGDPLSNGIKSMYLAFGANHTLMLLRDSDDVSTLWACGDGRKGQIGEEHRAPHNALTNFRRIELDRPHGYEYSGVEQRVGRLLSSPFRTPTKWILCFLWALTTMETGAWVVREQLRLMSPSAPLTLDTC